MKRFFLLAVMAIAMIGVTRAQSPHRSEHVTLDELATYIDTTSNADATVKLFYSNLVNNPTHSNRIEHFDVGFNGCTGRVDEHVVLANGSKRDNVFIFNNQGLLTQSSIQGSKNTKTVVDYAYTYDEVLRQEYTFNEKGQLIKLVITQPKAEKRTLIYQDGYVIREEKGAQVFRYHYDYDTATRKKFLIAIKELKGADVVHERTFDYDIDTHGRYTRVAIALDGKHQMTITRSYSD